MRGRLTAVATALVAMFCVSACGSGTNRSPAGPSAALSVAQGPGPAGPTTGASSVSWSCFTRASGTTGTFGASGCPAAARVTFRSLTGAAPLAAPSNPTGLTGTVTGSSVSINWTAPVGGDPPSSYIVQAGSAAGLSDLANFDTGSTATSLAVLGVPAGTYFVRVRANNSAGVGGPSNEFVLIVAGATPCGSLLAPTGLAASVTGSTVVLTWTAPAGCAPTAYIIQVGSAPGLSNLANFSTSSVATIFTANAVGAGTYYVRILSAASGVVSAPSTEISFVVGGCATTPGAPTNLAGSVSGSTLTLTWTAPTGSCPATSYLLKAGSSPGGTDLGTASVVGTSLTAAGLGSGTYYIRVYGVSAGGQSAPSNEIAVTIGPVAPVGLVASFQFFDPATQVSPSTSCRITSNLPNNPSMCVARSTSFATGANTIVTYDWTVQYTYGTVKVITQTGPMPTVSFSDTCGGPGSTDDGAAQPLSVTLTITDNLGGKATVTSGSASQPPLQLRLFKC